jgi:arylsulfatase A
LNRIFVDVLMKAFTGSIAFLCSLSAVEKPNIIVFLADDMGYGDCQVFNPSSKIKTPHIDQLAEEGMRFTDAHSASTTCTPSRYGLLTGINPCRTGVINTLLQKGQPIITKEELTIASFLQEQGYSTNMIGKWHLGFEMDMSSKKRPFDFSRALKGGPVDCGFDYYYGVHSSASSSPMFYIKNNKPVKLPSGFTQVPKFNGSGKESKVKIQLSPDFIMEELSPQLSSDAVRVIKDYAGSKREKPFFLYFASTIPHQPWVPSKKFKGKSGLGLYGDFGMQLDDELGQINQALKDTGLDKNTILIFTSDNGPGPGAVKLMDEQGHACTTVLRGLKSNAWEGGHRVPFIIKWPGTVKAGSASTAIINATDIFATVAQVVKVDLSEVHQKAAPDSVSFYPVLLDSAHQHNRPAMISGRHSVRLGDWKLTSSSKHTDAAKLRAQSFGLYNLKKDLEEKQEVSKENPERASQLFKEFQKFANDRKLKEAK